MKSLNKNSFALGILVGCTVMLCLALTVPQDQNDNKYHLTFHGAYTEGFVYNSTTGEFKQINWKDIKNKENGNLKEFFED